MATWNPIRNTHQHDASETTIADLLADLDLEPGDRICYLYDYSDGWRFYGLLKEIDESRSDDAEPTAVAEKGDPVEQYRGHREPR